MKYEFHPEALAEYKDAARYLSGLELRFIEAVEQAVHQILASPRQCGFLSKMFVVVSPMFFRTLCFIRLSLTMCSSLLSCTVAASRDIGGIVRNEPRSRR